MAIFIEHDEDDRLHYLRAWMEGEPNQVGVISWRKRDGEFLEAVVDERYRRQGIATALWRAAVTGDYDPPVRMTANRTDLGHAWADTLGTGVERVGDSWDRDEALRWL